MRLRPQANEMRNGCAPLAIAAVAGGDQLRHAQHGSWRNGPWGKRFTGMTPIAQEAALRAAGKPVVRSVRPWPRPRLDRGLPLVGKGVASIGAGSRAHAVAFDGKMVYDSRTGGRWMWAYDHPMARYKIRQLQFVEEA